VISRPRASPELLYRCPAPAAEAPWAAVYAKAHPTTAEDGDPLAVWLALNEDAEVGLNDGMMVFEEIAAELALDHPPQP
jgi:hypothetical protein